MMLFRNLLDKNIEKVLGITPTSIEWNITVTEPSHPDIAFVHPFDFHFDLLWFLIPMCVFRKPFESHFRKLIPKTVEAHLSRLAYQWEIRINKTIDEIRDQQWNTSKTSWRPLTHCYPACNPKLAQPPP
jgi:hypothetical protein